MQCTHLWPLLPHGMQEYLVRMSGCFCPLLLRYFPSAAQMQQFRLEEFGFRVPEYSPRSGLVPPGALAVVDASIQQLLPQLYPTAEFVAKRESIRLSLQKSLLTTCSDILPLGMPF